MIASGVRGDADSDAHAATRANALRDAQLVTARMAHGRHVGLYAAPAIIMVRPVPARLMAAMPTFVQS